MNPRAKILVVDDEQGIRDLLEHELVELGYRVVTAADGDAAVEAARREKFDLVISDVKMPKRDGLATLEAVKQIDPDVEFIMATAYGTIDMAVAAMKKGAYDFIQKPFHLDEIHATVQRALERKDLHALVSLYEASRAVFASVRLETLLPVITDLALRLLKADDASILLREEDSHLLVAACAGLKDDQRIKARLMLGERVAGRVAQGRDPVIITGPLAQDARFADLENLREIASSIVHPLVIGDQLLGVLCINRTTHPAPFTASDARYATIFASQIAQAVNNAKLYRRLEDKIAELDAAYRRLQETQAQLIRAEKLASVGQLAAGIAHELNNPLTSILGFAQLLLRRDDVPAPQREFLQNIESQGQRCARIVLSLLKLSRKDNPVHRPFEIVPLIREMVEFLRYDLDRNGIQAQEAFDEKLPLLIGDGCQIQQVFMNLITNAIHAMEGGSTKILEIRAGREGDRVRVAFRDTGPGVAPDLMPKLFEPFFTTKPSGKGTGLGLYISREIVQQHGGTIRAENGKEGGAVFTVSLPIAPAPTPGAERGGAMT
jgi:signal transduction histidine kinase/CheY-like chemotaxis protein